MGDMMLSPVQPLGGEASGSGPSHSFGRVAVHGEDVKSIGIASGRPERTETLPGEEGIASDPIVERLQDGDGGGNGGGAVPTQGVAGGGKVAAKVAKPSLSLSGDTYVDTATESHKKIKFNVTVPSSLTARDYALVNWVKGSMKDGSGKYRKGRMYGKLVDINFPSYQVDSVDKDPVYWSTSSGRWDYTKTSTGFYATDAPSPATSAQKGYVYALKFGIALYKLADVPTTTTGSMSAKEIEGKPWQYSVVVAADGKSFSHPTL